MKTLADIRKSKKLTIKQVAEKANVSVTYMSMLENNKRNPSDKLKNRLAEIYNVSPTTIFLASNTTKC